MNRPRTELTSPADLKQDAPAAVRVDSILAVFPRGAASRIQVGLHEWQGRTWIDFRRFYHHADGSWRPTRAGVRIHVDDVTGLARAIQAATRPPERGSSLAAGKGPR